MLVGDNLHIFQVEELIVGDLILFLNDSLYFPTLIRIDNIMRVGKSKVKRLELANGKITTKFENEEILAIRFGRSGF